AWMLTSTALVLLMTIPGLALFYGGMVRKKTVIATLMQSFAITCLVTVLWVIAGYSLAFMPGGSFIGSLDRLFLNGMLFQKDAGKISVSHLGLTIPESVYMTFQMTFAIITPALIAGAFADRMKFSAMLWFMGLWSVLIYSPIAHMMWEPSGYWAGKGLLDFAGGTVVHITPASGFVGATGALVIGIAAGVLCFFAATTVKKAFGYDDSLDAFGVHCIGGIVGAILTGVFNVKDISKSDADVLVQLGAVATTLVYSGVGSFIILKIIDMVIGLRVSEEEEREGLDVSLHGERVE